MPWEVISLGVLRYWWLVLRMALTHSLGSTQDTLFFLAIAVGVFTFAVPNVQVLDVTGWQVALTVFSGVVILRLLLAPYWIYKADQQTIERLQNPVGPTQEALDGLAELLSEGIHDILNRPVATPEDIVALVAFESDWNQRLFAHLDANFPRADALHVERLGTVPNVPFAHASRLFPQHQRILGHFARREERIRDLIRRGSRTKHQFWL